MDGVAKWARTTVEFPTWHLRSASTASGNDRLLPEQHFQLGLLTALLQQELLAEPEALSSERGRADVKVRWPPNPARRTCIELKVWGGTGYKEVVEQVLGYVVPGDDFGCVVMIDRQSKPLRERYFQECLNGGTVGTMVWPKNGGAAERLSYPAFITEHPQPSGGHVRIHHILVQLPPDKAGSGQGEERNTKT